MTSTTETKPFIKWAGSKRKLISSLAKKLPQFDTYYEPFVGSGALFFSLKPAKAVLSDINPELINVYRCIQLDVEALIEDLKKHYYEKNYFYQIRDADRTDEYADWLNIERASRFIYLNKTCFNGLYRVNKQGQFNTPFGRYKNPTILDESTLRPCSAALVGVELRVDSFDWIEQVVTSDDFVYFDPPYVPVSNTADYNSYSKDGFDVVNQVQLKELCERLHARGVKFMLSNSCTPLVQDLYKDFELETVFASRNINNVAEGRSKIKEFIVRNF